MNIYNSHYFFDETKPKPIGSVSFDPKSVFELK